MDLSIIIPTYGREEVLCKTIKSVINECENSKYSTELIVVDQTKVHKENTRDFLNNLNDKNVIKLIRKKESNLPAARNTGILESNGDIIMFLDDDVKLDKGFIDAHMNSYKDNPKVMATLGKVTVCNDTGDNVLLNNQSVIKTFWKKIILNFYKNYTTVITKSGLVISDYSKEGEFFSDTVIGCNMTFKKDIFKVCGLFDENYIGNAIREESDMSYRLRKKGYLIRYNSKAHLYHFMFNTGGCRNYSDVKYWESYFYNQCYFLIKNFGLSRRRIKINLLIDIIKCKKNSINANSIIDEQYKYIVEKMRGNKL